MRNEDEMNYHDDQRVRSMMEAGDMGLLPGKSYPMNLGSSPRAQIWRAVMGANEEEHLKGGVGQKKRTLGDRYYAKRVRPRGPNLILPSDRVLSKAQLIDLYGAIAYANSLGAVMNVHITISWRLLGYENHSDASRVLQSTLIKHMRAWHRHRQTKDSPPFVWAYVHECGKTHGFHTHFLTFVPPAFREEFRKWIRSRIREISKLGAVPKEAVHIDNRLDRPIQHQWRRFEYLCKTVDPQATMPEFPGSDASMALAALGRYPSESPGEVLCKLRMGIAREIGATERTRRGYRSLLEHGIPDIEQLYTDYEYKCWQWRCQEAQAALRSESASRSLELQRIEEEWQACADALDRREELRRSELGAEVQASRNFQAAQAAQLDRVATLFLPPGRGPSDGIAWSSPFQTRRGA